MTDSSSLANALSEPLRQPFWWAALASVGLHGVLGASAPTLSNIMYGGNSSKNLPGSVGLVELTAAEAGRLPQTIPPRPSNTPFSIAPVPLLPSSKLTPPLPPAPGVVNLPALPPGMPPPGFFSPLPPAPLPPREPLSAPPPPRTPPQNLPTPLATPTFIPPAPGGIQIFPPPGNFDRNIPPPPSPERGLPTFPPGGLEQDEGQTLQERIAKSRIPGLSDPNNIYSPEYEGYPNREAKQIPKLTQKDPNKRNLIAETPEERNRRQEFEAQQRQLGQAGQPGSNLPSNRETQLAAANTYVAMFDRFKTAYPDLEMTGPTPVDVAYPAAACSQKLEGVAVFGAVVNPQGLLKAEPQPIVPTGYSILDNAAKTAIINPNQIFPAASTHKLYQLAIPFKYDEKICSGIPVTPSAAPIRSNPAGQQPPAAAPTAPGRPTAPQPSSPAPAQVKPQFEKPPAASDKPKPGAQPSPPAQKPAPKPSPSTQPKPAPEVSPQPSPESAPSPAPEVSPSPEAAPSPTPEVSPSPEAEAAPSPTPEVSPAPEAEAAPSPAPEVSPSPAI